jgi:CubicO group peptidase (beta-lactamase class C family)
MRQIAFAALLGACGGGMAAAQTQPRLALPDTVDAYGVMFDRWAARHGPASATLIVRRGGRTIFMKGLRADASRPTLVASLSKAITGACVATLIRDGRLAFTTPMREALPQFIKNHGPPIDRRFEEVTVEQLLTHRSGLLGNPDGDPIHSILRRHAVSGLGHVAAVQPLLAQHLMRHRLLQDPGSAQSYSNTGYMTLAAVIEERTGRSYEDYCRDAVFQELGITPPRLDPDWRIFSGSGGWLIPGADYLALLDIFDPSHPFLGDEVKTWIDRAQTKWSPGHRGAWYSLGVFTRSDAGRWTVAHRGALNSRGRDPNGNPTAAFIETHGSRSASGIGVFFAYPWMLGAGEASAELRRDIGRAYQAIRQMP